MLIESYHLAVNLQLVEGVFLWEDLRMSRISLKFVMISILLITACNENKSLILSDEESNNSIFNGVWEEINSDEETKSLIIIDSKKENYIFCTDGKSSSFFTLFNGQMLNYDYGSGDQLSLSANGNMLIRKGIDHDVFYTAKYSKIDYIKGKTEVESSLVGIWEPVVQEPGNESVVIIDKSGSGYMFYADGKSSSRFSVTRNTMGNYDYGSGDFLQIDSDTGYLVRSGSDKDLKYKVIYKKIK